MKHKLLYLLICFFSVIQLNAEINYVLPHKIKGVKSSHFSLNGNWQLQFTPKTDWISVKVPGELSMQGIAIEHDKPVMYRKEFLLPLEWTKKKIILRFDGVYSYAKLWVNGSFVCDHSGGFTRWEPDITSYINHGVKNEIKLEVTDKKDDISYASGYAHHPIGGILRDVTLYTLASAYLSDFYTETLLDSTYQDAVLRIKGKLVSGNFTEIRLTLKDAKGKPIFLPNSTLKPKSNESFIHDIPVISPEKWDAEHPYLYTLEVNLFDNNNRIAQYKQSVGFRDISIRKNRMFVNGLPVKLRGACRHDIHPTLGRIATAWTDSIDAALYKQANMNFVRTSHYPPTERFVEYCDKMGIYVECETAVCFAGNNRPGNYAGVPSYNNPKHTSQYLSQIKEMFATFRQHPSVLFWSVGNESHYGTNFQLSYNWLKMSDTTRPVIFSWPGTVPQENKVYDLLSMHYPDITGNQVQTGIRVSNFQNMKIPTIFDEWAHVACYAFSTLQEDPNIRDFWGQSLDKMWSNLFESPGGLGGAIWGFVDETFMLPKPQCGTPWWITYGNRPKPQEFEEKSVGYGEWGVVDVWRRKKPEFWSVKKAYSPVRLLEKQVNDWLPEQPLPLPVYNRFDHTDLNELNVVYTYKGKRKSVDMPSISPHNKGVFYLSPEPWGRNDSLILEFYSKNNDLIDIYTVTLGSQPSLLTEIEVENETLNIEQTDTHWIISGKSFQIPFNKKNGLIDKATSKSKIVIDKGPFFNLDINKRAMHWGDIGKKVPNYIVNDDDWKVDNMNIKKINDRVDVYVKGSYQSISVNWVISVYASGKLSFYYDVRGATEGLLREAGIRLLLPDKTVERIKWDRKGYWCFYPENSLSGNTGEALLYNTKVIEYGKNPKQPWILDTHNYYYFGDAGTLVKQPLTQISKAMKENIYNYSLFSETDKLFSVLSKDAKLACRLNNQNKHGLVLYINNRWDYPEITWSDDCVDIDVNPCYGKIIIEFD